MSSFDSVNYNEDWIKVSYWDMPRDFDTWMGMLGPAPPATNEEKAAWIAEQMKLPSWEAAPVDIKRRAAELIRGAGDSDSTPDAEGNVVKPAVDWDAIWRAVTEDLAADPLVPKFLTEEGIRLATLRALSRQIDVMACARTEYPALELGGDPGARIDLVVQEGNGTTAVEFKYPREPKPKEPATGPYHLGHVLADTYRLGVVLHRASAQRSIQILVSAATFLGFAQRTFERLGLAEYGQGELLPRMIFLTPECTQGLPDTARKALKGRDQQWEVTAKRTTSNQIENKGLWLAVFSVSAVPSGY